METISYKLEVFEGPLDLLLSLISKNKLNIYDIPVAELLDQYMAHIEKMRQADMDIASEFLTMASRLVYIKTVMLMPHQEEAEELKRELTGELIEYQLCREMAGKLADMADFDKFSREEMVIDADKTYKLTHDVSVLMKAYLMAAGRKRTEQTSSSDVFKRIATQPVVSVPSRISYILEKLYIKPAMSLHQLFLESRSKSEAVATFLAVLDLIKDGRIELGDGDDIKLSDKKEGLDQIDS